MGLERIAIMSVNQMERHTKGSTDVGEAAIVMAIGIVVERVSQLSKEDKADLFELVKELGKVPTEEELDAIRTAMREILDQVPSGITRISSPGSQPEKYQKWIAFVSRKIRELRKAAGLTQDELAEKSGLPQSHISRLEAGHHSPSRQTLNRLAKALKVNPDVLDPSA